MIKLRLVQPGHPDIHLPPVEGDQATLGRDETCDLVIAQNFVSKRHLQILHGLVLVDLRSSNGTFIDGEKVTKPTLLAGKTFSLAGRLDVVVETEPEPDLEQTISREPVGPGADELKIVRKELESERARASVLAGQLAEAREVTAGTEPDGAGRLVALQAENEDLRRRLDALKDEIEGRVVDDAASLQARLAAQQLQEVQRQNQELTARIGVLEERSKASNKGGPAAPDGRDDELARLRSELDQSRRAALPPGEFFALIQRENQELHERLARLQSGASNPAIPATELFYQLQSENDELRRKLELIQSSPAPIPRAEPGIATMADGSSAEFERLRTALAVAQVELGRLRRELAAQRKGEPVPARPSGAPSAGAAPGQSILRIARLVAELDIERVEAKEVTSTEDFLVLETLRFVREAERVITRLAGQMIQLYDLHTILPDVEGNFRSLTRGVVNDPTDEGAQQELAKYLAELKRWLVVSVAAPRKAALEFTAQLKQALTEEALTKEKPIPAFKKVSGQREAELWKRACEHLKELSPELIEDRLEKLGRHTAQLLLGSQESAS